MNSNNFLFVLCFFFLVMTVFQIVALFVERKRKKSQPVTPPTRTVTVSAGQLSKTTTYSAGLSFAELREANLKRCAKWHPGGITDWSSSDWGIATMGELGEAANVVKKLNRLRDGIASSNNGPGESDAEKVVQLRAALAKEFADAQIYLDLWAARNEIDLAAAVVAKFNEISIREGFPDRL